MVAAYRMGWLTHKLMNPLITARYMTLVDTLLDARAVPEFYQDDVKPEAMAAALVPLLTDPVAQASQVVQLDEAMRRMGCDEESPSLRAARALLDFIAQ